MRREVSVQAPGKINFHLEVAGKQEDGYHRILSLFQTVSLYDQLKLRSLTNAKRIELRGSFSCPREENLIYKAARLFLDQAGENTGVAIEVDKKIPEGSGLGGGSSDGAGTLLGMNALLNNPFTENELVSLSTEIGSDVPFFLSASAAVVSGRGELITPVVPRTGFPALLIFPNFSISTAEGYKWIDQERVQVVQTRSPESVISMYENNSPGDWDFCNTFDKVLLPRFPVLKKIIDEMDASGALFSGITGSGSTVFALFSNREGREKGKRGLSGRLFSIWEVEILDRRISVVLQ